MATESGIGSERSDAPGSLEKFHLGLAADGMTCALVFVDERRRSIACIASFADLNGFIVSLTHAATEMAKRRASHDENDAPPTDEQSLAFNVTSSSFQLCADDGSIVGALVGDGGQIVPVCMKPIVANEMMHNMLKASRVASSC